MEFVDRNKKTVFKLENERQIDGGRERDGLGEQIERERIYNYEFELI